MENEKVYLNSKYQPVYRREDYRHFQWFHNIIFEIHMNNRPARLHVFALQCVCFVIVPLNVLVVIWHFIVFDIGIHTIFGFRIVSEEFIKGL